MDANSDLALASVGWMTGHAGKLVPAGSDIIVSFHYTTNGKPVVDRSKIGFTVAKTPPPKKFVVQHTKGSRAGRK